MSRCPDRTWRVVEDLGRNGAEHESAKRSPAVRRHHDQVRIFVLGVSDDLLRRISDGHMSPHVQPLELICHKFIEQIGPSLRLRFPNVRLRWQCLHMQHCDFCIEEASVGGNVSRGDLRLR